MDLNSLSKVDQEKIKSLVKNGEKLEAVKVVRILTNSSLKDARDLVYLLDADLQRFEPRDMTDSSRPKTKTIDAAKQAEIDLALKSKQKISAIKIYREATECSLKDAKDAVESRLQHLMVMYPGEYEMRSGCLGVLLLVVVGIFSFEACIHFASRIMG